jgi:hypothetical protein
LPALALPAQPAWQAQQGKLQSIPACWSSSRSKVTDFQTEIVVDFCLIFGKSGAHSGRDSRRRRPASGRPASGRPTLTSYKRLIQNVSITSLGRSDQNLEDIATQRLRELP